MIYDYRCGSIGSIDLIVIRKSKIYTEELKRIKFTIT